MLPNPRTQLYSDLRRRITDNNTSQALDQLKLRFKEDIQSNRMYDNIRTISELISVLEKRDVLNEDQIYKLKEIECIMTRFSPQTAPSRRSNPSIIHPITYAPPSLHSMSYSNNSPRIHCSPKIKAEVYKKIASQLGRHWKEFGRCLSVPESTIDKLNDTDSLDKVYSILNHHEQSCDPRRWKTQLLKALIDCRRRDISENVELIFDTHPES